MRREALNVFISYSHEDEWLRKELERHLALLRREGKIRPCSDRKITAGEEWRGRIDEYLESADVILLLVSASFIESDYCWDVEMKQAIKRCQAGEARLVPILVRPCDWESAPFAEFQALPRDNQAVTQWPDRDMAWLQVAHGIRKIVEILHSGGVRHQSVEMRRLSSRLKELIKRRKEVHKVEGNSRELDLEILDIRRSLRKGPQLVSGDFLLEGRYELWERVGKGGFASVWRSWDEEAAKVVALKVLHSHHADDRSTRERFFRGARIMRGLTHPHIVQILKQELVDEGFHFFAMEYLSGGDFENAVVENKLDLQERIECIVQVGGALDFAHEHNAIHRDVKPSNIILDEYMQPKLTDFDLVLAHDSTRFTDTHGIMGTFPFAPPEVLSSAKAAGRQADVFSLGATAAFALHGRRIESDFFQRREAFIDQLNISRKTKNVLLQSTATLPQHRHSTVREFCEALQSSLAPTRQEVVGRRPPSGPIVTGVEAPRDTTPSEQRPAEVPLLKRSIVRAATLAATAVAVFSLTFFLFQLYQERTTDTNTVIIGAILPLTGNLARLGARVQQGIELAVHDVNSVEGIAGKTIQVKYEDSRGEIPLAFAAFRKLVESYSVPVVLGEVASGSTLALSPLAEDLKIVLISPTAQSSELSDAGSFVFHLWPTHKAEARVAAMWALNQRFNSAAILRGEAVWDEEMAAGFASEWDGDGLSTIKIETYPRNNLNFLGLIKKLAAEDVDLVFLTGSADEVAIILNQARQSGWTPQFLASSAVDIYMPGSEANFVEKAREAAEGLVFTTVSAIDPENTRPVQSNFINNFENRFETKPDVFAIYAYDATRIVLEVMRLGATTGEEIRDAIDEKRFFNGVLGKIRLDDSRSLVELRTVKNGRIVQLESAAPQSEL